MTTRRFLRVAQPHFETDGTFRKRNDLLMVTVPAEMPDLYAARIAAAVGSGLYVEVGDKDTRLPEDGTTDEQQRELAKSHGLEKNFGVIDDAGGLVQ